MNLRLKPTVLLLIVSVIHSATALDAKISLAEANGIENSWIVQLNDNVNTEAAVATYADSIPNLNITETYVVIDGFAMSGSLNATEELVAKYGDDIKLIAQDETVKVESSDPVWGLDRIDQRDLPLNGKFDVIGVNGAAGVDAYIIDTGVRITHDEFKTSSGASRATWGINTVNDGNKFDCNGHGTHVAGTVGGKTYGVAKNVNIIAVKVLGCSGFGSLQNVIAGVDWVYRSAMWKKVPATANISLGFSYSPFLNGVVKNLHNSGVVTVVAAGNHNMNACFFSPASESAVITVGATTSVDRRATFSNYGPCLDIFAPGYVIKSAYIDSDSDTRVMHGTSMAAPHVCGGAALVLSTGVAAAYVGPQLVVDGTTNRVKNAGIYSPNKLLYLGKEYSNAANSSITLEPTASPTSARRNLRWS